MFIDLTPYPPTIRTLGFFIPICGRKGYGYFYEKMIDIFLEL